MNKLAFPGLGIGEFTIRDSISVFGIFELRLYAVIIAFGMMLAVAYAFWRFHDNKIKLDTVLDYAVWVLPMSIIGARLYYVFFDMIQNPDRYFGVTVVKGKEVGSFIGFLYNVVAVWEGGLAIYGGVIAGGLTIFVISLIKKRNAMKILDIAVPAVLFAQVLGRWGNFFNVEAFGYATKLPWRMWSDSTSVKNEILSQGYTYKQYINGEVGVHPTFLYESLWNIIGVILMIGTLILTTKILKVAEKKHINGFFFAFYMIWYGFGRMFIEGLRTDSLWLIPGVIRASIFVAVLTFIAGTALMVYLLVRKKLLDKKSKQEDKKEEVKDGTNN